MDRRDDGFLKGPFFICGKKKNVFPRKISATFQETIGVAFSYGKKLHRQIVANYVGVLSMLSCASKSSFQSHTYSFM